MTCKYLGTYMVLLDEVGSLTPLMSAETVCGLGRTPGEIGWVRKCQQVSADGPCWFWLEEHGPDVPDQQFKRTGEE